MSSRITHGMMSRNVLADLNAVSTRLSKTQQKIASNKEISRPSDDPFDASRAMALRQSLAATRQQQRNAQDAAGWQDATEQSLGQITDLVHRARELVVRGATDSADAQDRVAIATELANLDKNLDTLLEVRARNGARTNRLDSALSRLGEVEESTVKQLSLTEDADIAKTIIDFNSQQAAYQSALRAGASLVQASLLDFLR